MIKSLQLLNSRFVAILLALAMFPNLIYADSSIELSDYLEPTNLVKVFSYNAESFNLSGELKEKISGTMTESPIGVVEAKGQQFQTRLVENQGMPYAPDELKFLQRLSSDGIIIAYDLGMDDIDNQLIEHLAIPAVIKVGEPWPAFPTSRWESEEVLEFSDYESPVGRFEKCLRIRQFRSAPVGEGGREKISIYCPKIGLVSSVKQEDLPSMKVKTLTKITLQLVSEK